MRRETLQEKSFHDMLPPHFAAIAQVSFSYQDMLRIAQDHLKTFYEDRADWKKCIERYFHSAEYQDNCHYVSTCEDIPIVTTEQLHRMIQEDEQYQVKVKEFLNFQQAIEADRQSVALDDLYHAAELLGIHPEQKSVGLYNWIISRDGMSSEEEIIIKEKISNNKASLSIFIESLSTLFMPGLQLTYPIIETAMTQPKSKYYYRGESAYYGESKPGMYRYPNNRSHVQQLVNQFINQIVLNEACNFLDKFDAVRHWSASSINYVALAQHYGIKTPMLDITSDLKTALFFACCKYENDQWRPMTRNDFANSNKKYGILYRSPTEITDMMWWISDERAELDLIAPIGYQPFMRCSAQHGYMLLVKDEKYDMLKDPLFDKFRFEHDEEFCRWIFEEMDRGNKVYPHDDIPQITEYMERIKNSHQFSQNMFDHMILESWHFSKQEAQAVRQKLREHGYTIVSGQKEFITHNKLRKINRKYSVDIACSKLDIPPIARPMVKIPCGPMVEPNDEPDGLKSDL